MTLATVQPRAMALFAADPRLSLFAPYLVEDGVTDHFPAIDKALHAHGACILLADVPGGQVNPSDPAMATVITLPVFIFDAPGTPHEPAGLDLLQAVITALTARHEFRLSQFGHFKNEKGGTLTICEFNTTIVFNR